ncbi:bifunctional oligoribonuclease/PAP phosphatase NrnA [Halonotius terrestris]|uniref:Bifunctional oligoribonuclease/PAP phosphatase NrnA n=1 Tax=Halonotius terrestris TaxID=2487750 RepID=A0A8J8TDD4_9EURY|nr:DHHA1 domain-containing protein [Halonotius terrestris]TQQ83411.1 bifunctional oligoribonuclease/PAP phosphatase NrnA [Halonotius terrestris]
MAPFAAVGSIAASIQAAVESQPLLLAVILTVLGVVVAVVAYWWLRTTRGEEFVALLEDWEEAVVLMHPNPDPDAMAAATAISDLGEQYDTDIAVNYPGQIRHQENRAFRTVLDLDIDPIDHVTELACENVILVDHNTPRGFDGCEGVLPAAVVDHHPGDGTGELFTDVRTDYGSCSSIVAEYFRDIGAVPVAADQHASETGADRVLSSESATGLLYGILSDTRNLTVGATAADFEAASYLYPGVDEDRLDRIANPEVDAEVLEVKARAIAGRQTKGSFAVSDVGTVTNADAIPQAADEIIRLEGITAVVVCGERQGTIHISGRSRDDRVHMGRALEQATEDIPNASAGGHARMGGGQISPQRQLSDGGEPTDRPEIARDQLVDRIFASLSGDV